MRKYLNIVTSIYLKKTLKNIMDFFAHSYTFHLKMNLKYLCKLKANHKPSFKMVMIYMIKMEV